MRTYIFLCKFFLVLDKHEHKFYNIFGDDGMERCILHIDVNNAFLSWTAIEMLKNGGELDIRTIPAVIGGDESRRAGVVLAKSQKAKEFGIVTGEPLYQARKKCPGVQTFPSNYLVYKSYSNRLYQLFLEYTDKIERFSIDECFLDMTAHRMGRDIMEIAQEIRTRVKTELGFTVNIGIAPNKLLAKMASDFSKPDKIHTLYFEEIEKKMWPLPVKELFMLGRRTVPKLYNMKIQTIGDLAHTDEQLLIRKFGKFGKMLWEYANGIDDTEVNEKEEVPKGIGNSTTLPMDVADVDKLEEVILALTEQVTYRLRTYDMLATVVNVQLKTKDFVTYSHQKKLYQATSNTTEIYETAKELFLQMYHKEPIRLVGVRVDGLVQKDEVQLSFFSNPSSEKNEKIDRVVDDLKKKFGYRSITRASSSDLVKKAQKDRIE